MNQTGALAFARPTTPAARTLHLLRQGKPLTRASIVESTGLSQPTITRAVTNLINAGFAQERPDLATKRTRGRPTIPVDMPRVPTLFAGIAIGTTDHFLGIYSVHGTRVHGTPVRIPVADMTPRDFFAALSTALHDTLAAGQYTIAALGVTTSGRVLNDGTVDAPNLGWEAVPAADLLREHVNVPVSISGAVPAILGSEIHSTELTRLETTNTLALFADDSLSAAVTTDDGAWQIRTLPTVTSEALGLRDNAPETSLNTDGFLAHVRRTGLPAPSLQALVKSAETTPRARAALDERGTLLARLTAELIARYQPSTVVLAGSTFTEDKGTTKAFSQAIRQVVDTVPELRLIPTHNEIVQAIARAAALDPVLRDPLRFPVLNR